MDSNSHLHEGPLPATLFTVDFAVPDSGNQAGAVAQFLGRVRNDTVEGKTVTGIEYSAYAEMIAPVVDEICRKLYETHSDLIDIRIVHSTGLVQCGEISLAVQVETGHRKQAFSALSACVELIKEKLPVWKKEIFADGTSRWIE